MSKAEIARVFAFLARRRAKKLTPEQRSAIARKGGLAKAAKRRKSGNG